MLNLDWFQPFEHTVGVLYITVLNLPRHENVLLIGIIPALARTCELLFGTNGKGTKATAERWSDAYIRISEIQGDSSTKYSYILSSPVSQQHLQSDGVDFQPGQVETILMHQFEYNGSRYINVFALVNWFAAHSMRFKFGKPLQLWSCTFHDKNIFACLLNLF